MTRRLTISLPDDLAIELKQLPADQVSGYVAEALRRRRISDGARAALHAAGHREFPFDPIGTQQRLAGSRVDAQTLEAAVARVADLTGRHPDMITEQLRRSTAAYGW